MQSVIRAIRSQCKINSEFNTRSFSFLSTFSLGRKSGHECVSKHIYGAPSSTTIFGTTRFGAISGSSIHRCFVNLQKAALSSTSNASIRVLYSFWQSSCSWRVRFALNLKGLDYEYKSVDLVRGEQFTPEFEQINPLYYIPVLVDDGVVVSDSLAIVMFLEDKYPQKPLLPVDPCRRAVNLQVASIVSSSIQPLHMNTVLESIKKKIGQEEGLAWAQMIIGKGFLALEKLLKDSVGRYATGDEVSMADVFLAPQISTAMSRFDIDMSKYPTLHKVYESYKALPEFQASIPERQPEAIKQ